jgi:hypothetical protein
MLSGFGLSVKCQAGLRMLEVSPSTATLLRAIETW